MIAVLRVRWLLALAAGARRGREPKGAGRVSAR